MRVVDFFCGAGGFSEGFRQQGFNIIMGVDNWAPAVKTHNLNHNLNDKPIDILSYEYDWVSIDKSFPDSEIIIGSPPCVDFSMSNRAGKSYKGLGIRLIETYLRIIVIKKYKSNSILKSWLMENVPNSRNFVKENYSLRDLNLIDWAFSENLTIPPDESILSVKNTGNIFNAADFGSPQGRKRYICGEIIGSENFPTPKPTHNKFGEDSLKKYVWLSDIKKSFPSPILNGNKKIIDPNYQTLSIKNGEFTDHFYDSGAYEVEWEKAKFLKTNHPYMGKMQFPEGENRTSRTVMATRSVSTREALIYKSEYNRLGDGEFRLPTIREISSLMGFPISYQFTGSEGTKWRQIGNAVCPHMSSAIAKVIRSKIFELPPIQNKDIDFSKLKNNFELVENLNNFTKKIFNKPPKKNIGAKFRRHPFKSGNITVALMNHNPFQKSNAKTNGDKWYTVLYKGSGKNYSPYIINQKTYKQIEKIIEQRTDKGIYFIDYFSQDFSNIVPKSTNLQLNFENNKLNDAKNINPIILINSIQELILEHYPKEKMINNIYLEDIPIDKISNLQLVSMWSIEFLVSNQINV